MLIKIMCFEHMRIEMLAMQPIMSVRELTPSEVMSYPLLVRNGKDAKPSTAIWASYALSGPFFNQND